MKTYCGALSSCSVKSEDILHAFKAGDFEAKKASFRVLVVPAVQDDNFRV